MGLGHAFAATFSLEISIFGRPRWEKFPLPLDVERYDFRLCSLAILESEKLPTYPTVSFTLSLWC